MTLKRIRIGDMSITTTQATMTKAFTEFGSIVTSSVDYGARSAIGHIEYTEDTMGRAAINAMNGTRFEGALITVVEEK